MTRMDSLPPNYIECAECKTVDRKTGPTQRYCKPCSRERARERGAKWARENSGKPLSVEQRERRRLLSAERRDQRRAAGAAASERRGEDWTDETEPTPLWSVRVAVPFTYAWSKNHIYGINASGGGHKYLREEASSAAETLAGALRAALAGQAVRQNRLWLDILVQKPDHRGDAVNVVDLVSDAVQKATGLDDRWYSIARLDWEVVKEDPLLYVGISQESDEDTIVCSYCGRVLGLGSFTRNKGGPFGRARTCKECSRAGDRIRRTVFWPDGAVTSE